MKTPRFALEALLSLTCLLAACAAHSDDDAESSEDAVTACTGAIPDRTHSRVSELPFQKLNRGDLPAAIRAIAWTYPTRARSVPNNFGAGRSYNEGHEGADLGGGRGDPILAAAAGKIVYTLKTCPDNATRRDIVCGNGWGNHVVIDHGGGVFTRYAHLSKVDVSVGATVAAGAKIGALGHSGLSDGPHLHFELGTRARAFDPCKAPQNFDLVHNPAKLAYGGAPSPATPDAFTARWCEVKSTDGKGNVRKTPNGEILHTLNNGAKVQATAKDGAWYSVAYRLFGQDWQGVMHDSVLACP